MNRPLTDLGIVRTTIPEALQTAVAAPYAAADPTDCQALDLPYRGILRRLTGADKRDRARTAAVLAGMVRRAWLKGLARNANCPVVAPQPPAAG